MTENQRAADLDNFYAAMDRLEQVVGGLKTLAQSHGRLGWPRRGVYFFYESGEFREGSSHLRVVRVGTHALTVTSKTTLWNRLSQHRGTVSPVGGNHRGSIFRLLIGDALLRSGRIPDGSGGSWGRFGGHAERSVTQLEVATEVAVSAVIGAMPFVYLAVDGPGSEGLRASVERDAIGLLSNYRTGTPIDPPSAGWLGRHSSRPKVVRSGLWNQDHVDAVYRPEFLLTLNALIEQQGALVPKP